MTVKELQKSLECYEPDAHVCIAMVPDPGIMFKVGKYEVHGTWVDDAGVLNIIGGRSACEIDPRLKAENDLE